MHNNNNNNNIVVYVPPESEDGSSRDRPQRRLPVSAAEIRAGAEEETRTEGQTGTLRDRLRDILQGKKCIEEKPLMFS